MTTTKKKAFGSKRAGTGTIEKSQLSEGTDKWIASMGQQATSIENKKKILAKFIPTELVETDPHNPRKLRVSDKTIRLIQTTHPIKPQWLNEQCEDDWLTDYLSTVESHYELYGKAREDFHSILDFALGLKSAERLINPITVIKLESTFRLIAGERRLLAHLLLGEANIAASIKDADMDREDLDRMQWEENILREDMTLPERIDQVEKLAANARTQGISSIRKLANVIGLSPAVTQRYMAVINCKHTALMDAIRDERVRDLKQAAKYAQLSENELLIKLGSVIVNKEPRPAVKFTKKVNLRAVERIINSAANELNVKVDVSGIVDEGTAAQALHQLIEKVSKV